MADPPAERPRPPQTPPQGRPTRSAVAARRSNLFVLLALASLVTAQLPLPWGLAGPASGVAALVLGLMAVTAALDARLPTRRLVVLWVSLGVVAVVVLVQLLRLVFYQSIVEEQDCRREAITRTAQAACAQEAREGGLPQR